MQKFLLGIILMAVVSFGWATPDDLLVIALPDEIDTTDPMFSDSNQDEAVSYNVYEGLGVINADNSVSPLLASSWEVSEDGSQYTFSLREGVTFHTGKTMTCQDAEYSLRAHLIIGGTPEFNYTVTGYRYWDDEEGLVDATPFTAISEAVYCDDQDRLVVKLAQPTLDSLAYLTVFPLIVDMDAAMMNGGWSGTEDDWKDWAGAGDDFERAVLNGVSAGTGAYQLVSFEAGRSVFQAFAGYWGDKPAIETVVLQIITDNNSRVLALTNGDIDAIYDIPSNYRDQLEGVKGVVADQTPWQFMQYLIFNQGITDTSKLGSSKLDGQGVPADFFNDVNLRRAFLYAFDDQFIIDEVFNGKARSSQSLVPSFLIGGDFGESSASLYDIEKATEYFKQAWDGQVWENGFTLTVGFAPEPGLDHLEFAFIVLKDRIEAINPKFRLQLEMYVSGDDPLAEMYAQAPLFIEYYPLSLTSARNLEKLVNEEGYYTQMLDDTLVELSDQVTAAPSLEERLELFKQVRDYSVENAPFIVYPEHAGSYYYSDTLKGVEIIPSLQSGIVWKKVSK